MKLYLNPSDEAKEFYINHKYAFDGDSGIDLYFPKDIIVPAYETKLIDLEITCELRKYNVSRIKEFKALFKNLSYFIIPRSSISKTPLRMSNSIGLIDSNYRHTLKVCVDNITDKDYTIKKGDKLFQLISPNLEQFDLIITDNKADLSSSIRGEGFGSSN